VIADSFARLQATEPELRVVDFANTSDARFVTADGRSTYAMVFTPAQHGFSASGEAQSAPRVLSRALPPGFSVGTTALNELANSGGGGGSGVLIETLLGALGALPVLAFVFGSFLALLPLLIAAVSITSTLLVVLGLTYFTDVSFVVLFLVALVGLGVAIDYSLLVVTRWREVRVHGRENSAAVMVAKHTAGRAVLFSGVTVSIGLVSLVVLPVPGLRSIGIGGMLIPVISVLVTLTLLPAILGGAGPRMDWPRVRHENRASRPWTAWASGVVRHKWAAAGGALVFLAILIIPVFGLRTGLTGADALSTTGPAHRTYQQLLRGDIPSGILTPIEVLVDQPMATRAGTTLAQVPGMATAVVPTGVHSNRNSTSIVVGIPETETVNSATTATVRGARAVFEHSTGVIGVASVGAVQLDYAHAVYGNVPLMLAEAVVEGLGRTGRLVTSAALILFLAFASLASAPSTDLNVFATALGAGVILDATIVRALLLPALVTLLGRWNWWMPTWSAKFLRVDPSPMADLRVRGPQGGTSSSGFLDPMADKVENGA
jgi:putative drug exporter of the RND superfamily